MYISNLSDSFILSSQIRVLHKSFILLCLCIMLYFIILQTHFALLPGAHMLQHRPSPSYCLSPQSIAYVTVQSWSKHKTTRGKLRWSILTGVLAIRSEIYRLCWLTLVSHVSRLAAGSERPLWHLSLWPRCLMSLLYFDLLNLFPSLEKRVPGVTHIPSRWWGVTPQHLHVWISFFLLSSSKGHIRVYKNSGAPPLR